MPVFPKSSTFSIASIHLNIKLCLVYFALTGINAPQESKNIPTCTEVRPSPTELKFAPPKNSEVNIPTKYSITIIPIAIEYSF